MEDAITRAQHRLGIDRLRPPQRRAVDAVLAGRDVLMEIGRAGRDGDASDACLFSWPGDLASAGSPPPARPSRPLRHPGAGRALMGSLW